MAPRVAINTNLFVGALMGSTDGANREVPRRFLSRTGQPILGAPLFHEYEDLFSRHGLLERSPLSAEERLALFAAFLSVCEWVRVYYLWRPNLPDEGDNHLVELAVAGGAEAIVTHNTSDLKSGELRFPGLRVVTPVEFLQFH